MKRLIASLWVALLALAFAGSVSAAELGDDGLHKADWMRDTFKDLQEDFADAKAEGKRLLLLVEQRGCVYCRKMHEETFMDPRVLAMLIMTPVQCLVFFAVAVWSGQVSSTLLYQIPPTVFWNSVRTWMEPSDLPAMLLKAVVFGLQIASEFIADGYAMAAREPCSSN